MNVAYKILCSALLLLLTSGMAFASMDIGEKIGIDRLGALVAEQRGKVVIVNFWASWCGPCRKEFPTLERLRDVFPTKKIHIIGISLDFDRDMYSEFAQRQGFGYPVYLGDERLMDELDIDAIPKTLIFDRQGKLAANHDGPAGFAELHAEIERIYAAPTRKGASQ